MNFLGVGPQMGCGMGGGGGLGRLNPMMMLMQLVMGLMMSLLGNMMGQQQGGCGPGGGAFSPAQSPNFGHSGLTSMGSPGFPTPTNNFLGGNTGTAGPSGDLNVLPPQLAGNDQRLAQAIESRLQGTPLAGQGLGAHFVAAGRQHNVDPMALVAISRHETNFGKLGVGVRKHMGVGAFDASPNKARRWDGAINQIYSGARTFANLRRKGGSGASASLSQQLLAVNRAGWATDGNWHSKVAGHYSGLASSLTAYA